MNYCPEQRAGLIPEKFIVKYSSHNKSNPYITYMNVLLGKEKNAYYCTFGNKQLSLFQGCTENKVKLIKYLINFDDVNINQNDRYNVSPLFYTIINNYHKLAKILIDNPRLIVNNTNIMGETALSFACKHYRLKITKYLLQRSDIDHNIKDIYGRSAIFNICISSQGFKYYSLMNLKQKNNLDLNSKDKFHKTPIYYLLNNNRSDFKLYISLLQNPSLIIDQSTYDYILENKDKRYLNYFLVYYKKASELVPIDNIDIKLLFLNWKQSIINSNKIYVLIVLYSDNFLESTRNLTHSTDVEIKDSHYTLMSHRTEKIRYSRTSRFFNICKKLPIELQMIIANKCYKNTRDIISARDFDSQLIKFII